MKFKELAEGDYFRCEEYNIPVINVYVRMRDIETDNHIYNAALVRGAEHVGYPCEFGTETKITQLKAEFKDAKPENEYEKYRAQQRNMS